MKRTKKTKGFTLIELLVVIIIIAIMATLLYPVFAKARKKAYFATCQDNLKRLALATLMYTEDNDAKMPPNVDSTPFAIILPYFKDRFLACPSYKHKDIKSGPGLGYGMNLRIMTVENTGDKLAETIVLMADSRYGTCWIVGRSNVSRRHSSHANVGFLDGHVKAYSSLDKLVFEPVYKTGRPARVDTKSNLPKRRYKKGDVFELPDGAKGVVFQEGPR